MYLIREIYYFEKRWPFKIAKFKADEIFLLQILEIKSHTKVSDNKM